MLLGSNKTPETVSGNLVLSTEPPAPPGTDPGTETPAADKHSSSNSAKHRINQLIDR